MAISMILFLQLVGFFFKNDHDFKNDVKTCIVNVGIEIIYCSTLPQSSYING